jgi:hypothetical protein
MSGLWRAGILVGGAAVLVAVVMHYGPSQVAAMLWQIGWGFAVLTALRAGYVALRAGALWRVIPEGHLSFGEVWWIRLSTEAVEMITFTGPFLAEPAKGWLLMRRGLSTAEAVGFVMTEFLVYSLVTALVSATALTLLLMRVALPAGWRTTAIVVLSGLAAFVAAFAYSVVAGRGLITPAVRFLGNWLGRGRGSSAAARLEPGEQVIVRLLANQRGRVREMILLQLAAQVLIVVEVWVVFSALRTGSTAVEAFIFEGSLKFIDFAFFFVPGQLGAHEGFYSLIAGSLGIAPAAGLTLALARRIRGVLVGLLAVFARGMSS